LGSRGEPTYRLYNCARCGVQVRICRRCDHGQIYCAGECARIRRRESLRRAGARYQRTRRGALCHAQRQRHWRARREEVTHQGFLGRECCAKVAAAALAAKVITDAPFVQAPRIHRPHGAAPLGCSFCGAALPAWARLGRWPWSG
jgi:hypothetical protein